MDDFGSVLKLHQKDIRASFSFPSHCFKMQKNAKNCKSWEPEQYHRGLGSFSTHWFFINDVFNQVLIENLLPFLTDCLTITTGISFLVRCQLPVISPDMLGATERADRTKQQYCKILSQLASA